MANEHARHRARMRARIQATHFQGMAPHEVVEYLLYSSIPVRDVNGPAHRLIDRFGSLDGVLSAAPEELVTVQGIGPRSAQLLGAVDELRKQYVDGAYRSGPSVDTIRQALGMAPRPRGKEPESLTALLMGPVTQLISRIILPWTPGDKLGRSLIEESMNHDAHSLVLILSSARPDYALSPADWNWLREILAVLTTLEVRIIDVLVRCPGNCISLRGNGTLREPEAVFGSEGYFPHWFDGTWRIEP